MDAPSDEFQLKSEADGFEGRSKDVFSGLKSLEDNYLVDAKSRSSSYQEDDNDDNEDTKLKRRRREFKQPDVPVPKRPRIHHCGRRKMADHLIHPQSWTKYSLRETGEERMSEHGDTLNQRIALEFLQRDKVNTETEKELMEEGDKKIMFTKPECKPDDSNVETPKSSSSAFTDNVHRMPEYVIGKERRQKTHTVVNADNSKQDSQLELHHLDDATLSEETDVSEHGQSNVTPPSDANLSGDAETVGFRSVKSKGRKHHVRQRNAVEED